MQPNQQPGQSQSPPPVQNNGYVSPSGSNIPGFLQMDPIAEPQAPKSKKKPLIFALIVAIVIVVAGLLLYMRFGVPQSSLGNDSERFYAALEKLMQVEYVHREYTMETKDPRRTLSIVADSDLSNPDLPKSSLKFTANMGDDGSGAKKYAGEYRTVKFGEYAGLLKSATPNAIPRGVELDRWYRFVDKGVTNDTLGYGLVDFESRSTLNSPQGPLIIGNFKEDFRRQLLDLIKTKEVYAVAVDQDNTTDETSVYTITVSQESVRELNELVAKLYGIQRVHQLSTTSDDKMQLWIDNDSGRVAKVVYTNGIASKKTVELTYPSKQDITYPEDIQDAPN